MARSAAGPRNSSPVRCARHLGAYGLPDPCDPVRRRLLDHPRAAYISRYALGRDYHKTLRKRLQKLAIASRKRRRSRPTASSSTAHRCSRSRCREGRAGSGHTNLINRDAGSWFFLGELYIYPAAARGRCRNRALRQLSCVHRCLSHRCHRRA
ncbi:MAG: QueG-associated DUF1730 domain-containing protein [Woeseiaceae bacterium]|nr:QueG-associated DUF1730 domain-containing protein [Woeseiaceae bacterium]